MMNALEDLFLREMNEIYDAERRLIRALPAMAKASTNPELRAAFENHAKETRNQATRLEKCFRLLEIKPRRETSDAVAALIDQGEETAGARHGDPAVIDAGLITVAQKVEHYEIAAYGCVRTHAAILGYQEIADLLEASLHEEEQADRLLTSIAETSVNWKASQAPFAQARTRPRGRAEVASQSGGGSSLNMFWGLVLGSALAILFAPRSGKASRARLQEKAREQTGRLSATAEQLVEKGRRAIEREGERARF